MDADLPITVYKIYSYETYKRHIHDDEREVECIDLSYMDIDNLNKYIIEKKQEKFKFSKLNEEQIYEMLNIKRNGKFTLAAVMNFSLYSQGSFLQLGIIAVVVPGYNNILPLLKQGRLAMTISDIPASKNQRYYKARWFLNFGSLSNNICYKEPN